MPFSAPVLTYRAKALASNMCSKVLNGHIILTDTSITTILAPEMTYTPKIRVRCKVCNHEWSVAPTTLRRGSGCASCAGRLKLSHERFVERLNLLHPEIVPLTEYVNSQTRMTFECRACGHVWSAQAYGLIAKSRSSGCRKCSVRAMLRRRSRKGR